jgi:transcriptional regulator with XRE-family HTH domain
VAKLGDVLRRARERAKLSQSELADAAGVSQVVISRIEANTRESPRFVNVLKIAYACGLSLDRLASECGYSPPGGRSPKPSTPPSSTRALTALRGLRTTLQRTESAVAEAMSDLHDIVEGPAGS